MKTGTALGEPLVVVLKTSPLKGFRRGAGKQSRRRFLAHAGGGIALALTGLWGQEVEEEDLFRLLESGKRIEIGSSGPKMIEEAYRIGYEYEKRHGGCARCTVAAWQDAINFIPLNTDIFAAAICLDGGATPSGIQNCGAFTGSGIILGYVCGRRRIRFEGGRHDPHKLIRKVYEKFKEEYGSVLCQDVRKSMEGHDDKCPMVVGRAARWAAEAILTEFTDYSVGP